MFGEECAAETPETRASPGAFFNPIPDQTLVKISCVEFLSVNSGEISQILQAIDQLLENDVLI